MALPRSLFVVFGAAILVACGLYMFRIAPEATNATQIVEARARPPFPILVQVKCWLLRCLCAGPRYRHNIPHIPPPLADPNANKPGACDEGGCTKVKAPPPLADVLSWFPHLERNVGFLGPEYEAFVADVIARRPCNLLVFGGGEASALWRTVNFGGVTVFLEAESLMMNVAKDLCPPCDVQWVEYPPSSKHGEAAQLDVEKDAGSRAALVKDYDQVVKVRACVCVWYQLRLRKKREKERE